MQKFFRSALEWVVKSNSGDAVIIFGVGQYLLTNQGWQRGNLSSLKGEGLIYYMEEIIP